MSVEYGKPHAVDVPVVDLDDPGDEILYLEHNGNSRRFLDDMDFETPPQRGWLGRLSSYFNTRRTNTPYELARSSLDFFDLSDDENVPTLSEEGQDTLRDYRIKRLNQKLNRTILAFAALLVFLVGGFFLSRHTDTRAAPLGKRVLSNSTHDFYPSTILVSLDGFHPHYINAHNTPALHKMMVQDYGAPYMTPSFPSSTFPNHWTLVTGLFPSEHGIVGNTFFDPKLGRQFINTNPEFGLDPEFWRGGEPIWTTAHRQGVKSAVHMWPGSEVPTVGDNGPMFVDRYNGSELLSAKVDRVMGWLDAPKLEDRPELMLTYVPTIDQFGHKFGISGQNLTDALSYVDDFIALMQEQLEARNLTDIVNLVVVSDHGMAPTSNDRLLFLDDVVNITKIEHVDGWPLFGLRPYADHSPEDIMAEIQHNLAAMDKETQENFAVYRVEDIPKEWNFGGLTDDHRFNYRLAPIWIVPNVGYSITTHKKFEESNNDYYPKGVHGYNNTHLLMRAIFLAQGPYFSLRLAEGHKVLPFANTEVYGIICDSLDIQAGPNNGSSPLTLGYAISSAMQLPDSWTDLSVYPGLLYEVEHIVKNATYDQLWRLSGGKLNKGPLAVSSNQHPYESLMSEEQSLLSVTSVSLPKPSDFEAEASTQSESGFEKIMEGIDDVIDDAEDALGDVVGGALDMMESFLGSNDSESDEE